jgi:hypothetical protein
MADSTPAPPESATEAGSYRPLAGLALASIVVAGGYALLVSAFALMAIIGGNPVFLSPWALVFPVTAVILASAARWQIRNSEGARSGLTLANWGWWLGLIFGVVHAAIFFGTLLAVWTQAQGELERSFFAKIRQGDLDEAFQFSLDPDQRATSKEVRERFLSMEGGKKGPLSRFKENEMVRIIQTEGEGSRTESLGIKSLPELASSGYGVVLTYRITNPEGVFDIQFTLRSKDHKESRKRRWRVILKDGETFIVRKELSPVGEKMRFWQNTARDFATAWISQRNLGFVDNLFLNTCPPQSRESRRREYQTSVVAGTLASVAAVLGDGAQSPPLARFAPFVDRNLGCELYLRDYQRFSRSDFIESKDFEAPRKHKEQILAEFTDNFLHPDIMGMRLESDPAALRRVDGEPPHLEALVTVELGIVNMSGSRTPKYVGTAEIVAISDRVPEGESEVPQWRIASLRLLAGAVPPEGPPEKSGGMPGMMGGGPMGQPRRGPGGQ